MKSILVELTCRQCLFHTYRKSETLVISDFETQARADLLQDTYFTMRCPQCGNLIEFIHPLSYVDTKHKFILLIKAKKDFTVEDKALYSEDSDSCKRFIYDHTRIAEKIRILEDELDDRAIELIKARLNNKYQSSISLQYHDLDKKTQTIWFEKKEKDMVDYLAVTFQSYTNICKRLPPDKTTFELIDESWTTTL